MIKLNEKSGFSLAESLISMMLLVLTIMLSMASITRKKHHPKTAMSSNIGGMYAVWNDGSSRNEYYCTGNHCEKTKKENLQPDKYSYIFKKDRRANKYYIYAVGSRYCEDDKCVDGQVVFNEYESKSDSDENKMKLDITLGDSSKDPSYNLGNTEVKEHFDDSKVISKALGGLEQTPSNLVFKNIKDCRFLENSPCEAGEKTKCETAKDEDNDGFATLNLNCNNKIKCHLKNLSKVPNTTDKYTGKCTTIQTMDYEPTEYDLTANTIVKVTEEDSSLKAVNQSHTKNSEFVKKLKMLPSNYRNGLFDKILNYYQNDDGAKDGIVLIIW